MVYGWTVPEVETLTWPQVKGLLSMIERFPTEDVIFGRKIYGQMHRQAPANVGLPVKHGKVRRRKDGD